jgi:iron-sulfur cluster assembly protein
MVQLTERAVGKVKEIMASQDPLHSGLRIAVVGGGCSGFSYSMAFENQPNMLDKTYQYDGLKVYVDQASLLYLEGAEVDIMVAVSGLPTLFEKAPISFKVLTSVWVDAKVAVFAKLAELPFEVVSHPPCGGEVPNTPQMVSVTCTSLLPQGAAVPRQKSSTNWSKLLPVAEPVIDWKPLVRFGPGTW